MPFSRSGLIISLALSIGLAPFPARADTARVRVGAPCFFSFAEIASKPPRLNALKKDLPDIQDPIRYLEMFENRRNIWNLENSNNRNNFPMPEMKGGVEAALTSLRKVKRPPENRLAAERYIRELTLLKKHGFPYRDSLLKLHEALNIVALKHPLTPEVARAMKDAGLRPRTREAFDATTFFTQDNVERRIEFEAMMEKEIFYPTAHNQTVDGLAESFLLGIRPLQVTERASVTDQLNMTSLHRFEHDVAHIVIQRADRLSRAIAELPLVERVGIARDIGNLPTERERHLARFGVFQTLHEWGIDSMVPYTASPQSIAAVQAEYRTAMGREISQDEVAWVQRWYQNSIGRRLFDAQNR